MILEEGCRVYPVRHSKKESKNLLTNHYKNAHFCSKLITV